MSRGASHDVTLTTPVPVHVTYFTASVDDAGKLHWHGDLYGQDGRVASALSGGRAVPLAAVPVAAAETVEPGAGRREVRRSARAQSKGQRAKAASADGSPFGILSGLFAN